MKGNRFKRTIQSLTGKETVIRENLSVIYSGERLEQEIRNYRRKLVQMYLAVTVLTILLTAVSAVSCFMKDPSLSVIFRPGEGEGSQSIPVTVQGSYKGHEVESSQTLQVSEEAPSEKKIRKRLSSFAAKLADRIAPADQQGIRTVTGNLELPEKDEKTGIELYWESSDPEVLSEDGELNIFSLEQKSETITLSALLTLNDISRKVSFDVSVSDVPEAYDDSLFNEMESLVEQLSEKKNGRRLNLPEETESGIRWKWSRREESNAPMIFFAGTAFFLCIYAGRYERAKKNAKKYREEVLSDFPSVVDKLVLLLNSGLTVFSALMRISSDYSDEMKYSSSPIASEIAMIGQRVQEINTPVIEEWKKFAIRMESSEILRFCTILEDNMSKGSELSVKLENESNELRDLRKKNIQKYIREIDSRMMIPMLLMLFSLVLVTIAPVLTGF